MTSICVRFFLPAEDFTATSAMLHLYPRGAVKDSSFPSLFKWKDHLFLPPAAA